MEIFLSVVCCVLVFVVAVQWATIKERNNTVVWMSEHLTENAALVGDLEERIRQQREIIQHKDGAIKAQAGSIEHLNAIIEIGKNKDKPLAQRPKYDYDKLPQNRNDL